ncbi:MAG: DUF4190 domain-containing protein [archaeon]
MGKGMAITAFVLSLLFFVPLAPLVGMVLGVIALVKSKNQPGTGYGFAIAAIVIGVFTTIMGTGFWLAILKALLVGDMGAY